jgi:hypothetical protein
VWVLKLEFWPDGEGRRIKELGRIVIEEVPGEVGKTVYRVALAHRGRTDATKILQSPARSGVVLDHGRLSNNLWTLAAKALKVLGFRYTSEEVDLTEAEEAEETED